MKIPKGLKFKRTGCLSSSTDFVTKKELGIGDKVPCGFIITEILEREFEYAIKVKGIIEANNDWVDDEHVKWKYIAKKITP